MHAKELAYDEEFVTWWMKDRNKIPKEDRVGFEEDFDYASAQDRIRNLTSPIDRQGLASDYRRYKSRKEVNSMCEDEIMTKKERTYEPIRLLELKIKKKKKLWLQKYGWKESCDFADGGWRWVKQIGDLLYMCDMSEAINIECNCLE